MAIALETNYKNALTEGFQESWLFEFRNNTYTDGSSDTQYIRLGTDEVGSGDTKYHNFITSNPSVRESISLSDGTSKNGNITLQCVNDTLSNHSAKLASEIYNGARYYLNHKVLVYSRVGSISSGDYLKVFTGRLKSVSLNDNHSLSITIASATPIDFIKIPRYQSKSGNYYPIVYGDYKKAADSTDASPALIDADTAVKLYPVEVDTLNGGVYNCLVHKAFTNEYLHYAVKDAFRNSDDYPIFAPVQQLDGSGNITLNVSSNDDYEGATDDTDRNVMPSELTLLREYKYRPKILSTSEVIDSDNVHADPFLLEELQPQANAVDTSDTTFFQISHRVTSASTNANKTAQDFYKIKISPTKEDHKVTAYSVFISYDVASRTNGFGGSSSQDSYEITAQCIGKFDGDDVTETESDDSKDANGSYTHTWDFLADFSKSDGNAPASFEIAFYFNSVNMWNAETSSSVVKIKDIQIIAKAEIIDEGTDDASANPLEHQSAVTSVKKLYLGGDGFYKSWDTDANITNIVDMHRDILHRFCNIAHFVDSTANLAETLNATETGVDVSDGSQVSAGQIIKIDDEEMEISSISSNTLTVVRGVNHTTAASHTNGTDVFEITDPLVNTSNYAALVTARSNWKPEYWLNKELNMQDLLKKTQFEGCFIFKFRTSDGSPQYIYIPDGTISVHHTIKLSDISSFSVKVQPIDTLITKRIIKYQRSPISDSHLFEKECEDTSNNVRTNYNIKSNENVATNNLDILVDGIGAENTGSGNRNDGFANYYRYINGVPKYEININLINPGDSSASRDGSSNYFYGMEVGDFCAFDSTVSSKMPMFGGTFTNSKFIVKKVTRGIGSLKVTLREV